MSSRAWLALTLVACGGATPVPAPEPTPPRLVVLVVLDQWPQWAFEAKRPALTGGGFERLLAEGEWHTGRYPHGATLTGPGHALLGTGTPPATSGIIANEWWDRGAERVVKSVEDSAGVSAHFLRVNGLGDAVVAAGQGGRAVAISLKDRAAILPLGRAGVPVWYAPKQRAWISTQPHAWVDELNRSHPIEPRLGEVWQPLAGLAALSGTVDDQAGEVGEKGFGPTFPHDPATTPSPAEAVYAEPLGNTIIFEAARAAITGEQLGADGPPDLLVLSLSAHDYIGHGWGHESWEAWDLTKRIDAELGAFLGYLDERVGAGGWAMVVTSDHGAAPLPELSGGGRIVFEDVEDRAEAAARQLLGTGDWIAVPKAPYLYLTKPARELLPTQREELLAAVTASIQTMPGVGRVERTRALGGDCGPRTGEALELCLMIDPDRSGELLFLPKEGWIMEERDERLATAHGSLYDYDRNVPVIVLPPGRVAHAPLASPSSTTIPMTDISPLLARWLGVAPPTSLPALPAPAPAAPVTPSDDPS